MKKQTTHASCHTCQAEVREGQSMCGCGSPTPFMTFDERRKYEAARWRAYQEQLVGV